MLETLRHPHPSLATAMVVCGTLGLSLLASVATFWVLTARATVHRQLVALQEWAGDEQFRFRLNPSKPPEPFDQLRGNDLHSRLLLSDRAGELRFVQLGGYHLLIHRLALAWKPTGLRPCSAASSVLDRFSLEAFPLLAPSDRFLVCGIDAATALQLSRSSARGLLPPDIGLLLHGPWLVLDFSGRPFDVVELSRMRVIARQIIKHIEHRPA